MAELFQEQRLKMQTLTHSYVTELTQIWSRIFDHDTCVENLEKLVDHANNFYRELVQESIEKEDYTKNEIDNLKREADELKRLLKLDHVVKPIENQPLLVVQCEMDKSLAELRECLQQRKDEINELLMEQEMLCEELGELPRPLLSDPLATADEILEFRQHLAALRMEREQRLQKLSHIRSEIRGFLGILNLELPSERENRLLNENPIKLHAETFSDLNSIHSFYGNQVQEMRDQIADMKKTLEKLWTRLDTSPNTRNKIRSYTDCTNDTFDVVYGELNRCEALKRKNIKLFVQQIRVEITEWWDKTLYSETQRNRFSHFYSSSYTDDLLGLHEIELEDLKRFYETNREIFELYSNRNVLWERMTALVAKASDPNRYNNRGGQLLKEERERKTIATKLPKIEQQIRELVKRFEARENTPFLVYGKNILEVMQMDWDNKRQQKEKQTNVRKVVAQSQLTHHKSYMSPNRTPLAAKKTFSSATVGRTPTGGNNQSSTPLFNRRKLNPTEKLTPIAKRMLATTGNSPNLLNLKPTSSSSSTKKSPFKDHLKPNRVLATTIRRKSSSGRHNNGAAKKRRSFNRNGSSRANNNYPQVVVTEASDEDSSTDTNAYDDYDSFEKSIEPSARSSTGPNVSSKLPFRNSKKKYNKSAALHTVDQLSPRSSSSSHSSVSKTIISPNTSRRLKNLPIII